MISTLNSLVKYIVATLGVLAVAVFMHTAHAQNAQRLSVSPTLFEMAAEPKQAWRSSIKIVNPNPYDLTVYVEVVNFAPRGESGDGMLLPVLEQEREGFTLAEWIEYNREPIVIPAEKTHELPFTVQVPETAAPGGHFAAFMVGTKPPEGTPGASQIRTSQVVTSLFFVRVAGDVVESGEIREFRATERLYSRPEAEFEVRFQNTGNVHLRPQGDITIYNMWGQERGVIPINRQSHFGNVLPNSIRKFNFSWRSEWSLADMGRYRAVVTLAYGQDARRFVTSTTYFWVVPLMPLAIGLGSFALIVTTIVWLIRLYIRRMFALAGMDARYPHGAPRRYSHQRKQAGDLKIATTVPPPVKPLPGAEKGESRVSQLLQQMMTTLHTLPFRDLMAVHWRLIVSVVLGGLLLAALTTFVSGALTPQRSYEVTYVGPETSTSVSSDQILYEEQRQAAATTASEAASTTIAIVNKSGEAGAGAGVALVLEAQGYAIASVETDLEETQARTVIVYRSDATETALTLSKLLNNALLSAFENDTGDVAITIYVGSDVGTSQ